MSMTIHNNEKGERCAKKKRRKIAREEEKNKRMETIVIVVTIDNANVQMPNGIVRTIEYAYADVIYFMYRGCS